MLPRMPWTSPASQRVGALSLAALIGGAPAVAEPARGVFGVTLAVRAQGVLNPRVSSATIVDVRHGLPAARAGVLPGDALLEVDGTRVPGATAAQLAPLAQGKRVGERIRLVLARPDGQAYAVELVATPAATD